MSGHRDASGWRGVALAIAKETIALREQVEAGNVRREAGEVVPFVDQWARIIEVIEAYAMERIDEDATYLATVLRACMRRGTKRDGRNKGLLVWRSGAPKDTDARLFKRALDWHRGKSGGYLGGPIGDAMFYGDRWDRADTAAMVLLLSTGCELKAVDRWREALGMGASR